MSDINQDDVIQALGNLSVMEMIALTKELEQKWGVKAEPPKVQFSTLQPEKQESVQTEFKVFLVSVPADKKMSMIKSVRDILGLGLKEAKDFVEAAPKMVKEELSKEEATELQTKLTAAGGVTEIK